MFFFCIYLNEMGEIVGFTLGCQSIRVAKTNTVYNNSEMNT